MSEQHARATQSAAQAPSAPVGLQGWPFALADGDDDLHERLEACRLQMRAAIDANETLLRGMGGAAQKSLTVLQAVVDGTRDDLARAMRAGEPAVSARVQFDAFQERSRELLDGMRSVADDVYECWFTALGAAWASQPEPTAGPSSEASEDVVPLAAADGSRAPTDDAATAPSAPRPAPRPAPQPANEPGTRARRHA